VSKAVLISAIPPTFMKSEKNPDGVPRCHHRLTHKAMFIDDLLIGLILVGLVVAVAYIRADLKQGRRV
jgi:hypothetical protein